jgi:hypothetical protein
MAEAGAVAQSSGTYSRAVRSMANRILFVSVVMCLHPHSCSCLLCLADPGPPPGLIKRALVRGAKPNKRSTANEKLPDAYEVGVQDV